MRHGKMSVVGEMLTNVEIDGMRSMNGNCPKAVSMTDGDSTIGSE